MVLKLGRGHNWHIKGQTLHLFDQHATRSDQPQKTRAVTICRILVGRAHQAHPTVRTKLYLSLPATFALWQSHALNYGDLLDSTETSTRICLTLELIPCWWQAIVIAPNIEGIRICDMAGRRLIL